jgi:hypothetical protein
MTETVAARESITAPAGTFDSVRIHGQQCNETQPKSGCGDFDVWCASQVKYFVKIAWTGTPYWPTQLISHPEELLWSFLAFQ